MKVIFVGIHNKPGKQPLDSTTKTGKVIDAIIQELPDYKCVKSNLYDTNTVPDWDDKDRITDKWAELYNPADNDIIVLLGKDVQREWPFSNKSISVPHPAYAIRKNNVTEYIKDTLTAITQPHAHNKA